MVESAVRQVSKTVPVKVITASRGKVRRRAGRRSLQQGRVHHVGPMAKLEATHCVDPR